MIDGHVRSRNLLAGFEPQHLAGDGHAGVGRDHINPVGFHGGAILHLFDGHPGFPGENPGQHALVVGIEVLNQDEGQAGIEGKVIQQLSKSFQSAGRRSNAHHRDDRNICP